MEIIFKRAISLVQEAGYDEIAARLQKELDALNADTYRIAVVGEFKAGKSSLINRVFLKDDLLFTDVMEATAVPTEICYGKKPLLEVVPYNTTVYSASDPFNENKTANINVSNGEGDPIQIQNPTREDIRLHTSAEKPEERARLARQTARVRLFLPADNLKGLTLFDTPGINSLNEAVITTTYRIIPESDLVLFVTPPKQLSDVQIDFLSGRVFSEGITRAITVVTYDPEAAPLSADEQNRLIRSISAQLANIGRDYVPVEIVNIRDTGSSEHTSFKARVDNEKKDAPDKVINNVIGSLLGEISTPISSPKLCIAALEEKLICFIQENVKPARIEKANQTLKTQLQLALLQCATELSAVEKNQNERQQILATIKSREAEIRKKHAALTTDFRAGLKTIQDEYIEDIIQGLDAIAKSYIAGFDVCDELGDLQYRLNRSEVILKADMEAMFLDKSRQAQKKILVLVDQYGVESQVLLNPWQAETSQVLEINGGVLSRVPPFAVLALDFLLFVRFGPFGPLIDALVRLIANYIPYLNKIMPVAIAATLVKRSIKKSLNSQFEAIKADLPSRIEISFQQIADKLLLEWKIYADAQMNTVRKSLEKVVDQPISHRRKEMLSNIRVRIETMLADNSSDNRKS